MEHILLGIFKKQADADSALRELGDAGFLNEEISVIAREDKMGRYHPKYRGGEAIATGGILGGLAGVLIAATPIVLPGIGLLIAGPLTLITGLALGAATGGLLGALVDAGISQSQARSYERRIKEGEVLLGVQADDTTEMKAREILERHHAEELVLLPYKPQTKTAHKSSPTGDYASAGMKGGKATKRK